jgi:DNA-binding SARP family transcriptional activator
MVRSCLNLLWSIMEINILGYTTVAVDGRETRIPAARTRALLTSLALEPGRLISVEELADELWSGAPLLNARNALQANVTRLRRALQKATGQPTGQLVRAVPHGYLLDLGRESIDANRFVDLAEQGAASVGDDPARAKQHLLDALRLWRGPALVDGGDGLRCHAAAALLEEYRLSAWENLISARMALGEHRQVIGDLRQLVERDPLRECYVEQLMVALYRCGRQGEALNLFHQTRQRFDAELGVQPGQQLQRRYIEILAQDPALSQAPAEWQPGGGPVFLIRPSLL